MAKLASHNTMTYLPVRQWWLKPFAWMARCQSKTLKEQTKHTDFLEVRVRFDKYGTPVFAHGLAEYKHDWNWISVLRNKVYDTCLAYKPVVMVHLEYTRKKGLELQKKLFQEYCETLEQCTGLVTFCGGQVKRDWSQVYRFKAATPKFQNYTASTTGGKLDDLWPWLFAKRHNKNASKQAADDTYVRVDYIHTAK